MTGGAPCPACLPAPLVIQAALFTALLLAASVIDARRRIIPDSICALVALTGLICCPAQIYSSGAVLSPARISGILTALPLLAAAVLKPGSIGGGDIKLTAAAGFVLGFGGGAAGLAGGLAAMLLFFAGRQIIGYKNRKETEAALPMAPFLSAGFTAAYIMLIAGAQPG